MTGPDCECPACQSAAAPWEETPWWHPYRLVGLGIRQRVIVTLGDPGRSSVGECFWHYGRPEEVAHALLERHYATDVDPAKIITRNRK